MANDQNLGVRVSVLEVQMASVTADVAEIRANYVTKAYLDERLGALKVELQATLASKDELHALEERMHKWMVNMFVKMFLTLFFSIGGLLIALLKIYLHQ